MRRRVMEEMNQFQLAETISSPLFNRDTCQCG
ncbi:hypothetical protein DBO95_11715 [Yersinia pestis]|nr:hypothetical protein DBO95_11715 [Yersinia pestis]